MSELDPAVKNTKIYRNAIILAGSLTGLFSIIPFLNLLNIFFLFWFIAGGFFCIRQLQKNQIDLSLSETLLYSGLSGLLGGIIFSLTAIYSLISIPDEKFQSNLTRLARLMQSSEEDLAAILQAANLKKTFILSILIVAVLGIFAAACGGFIARLFRKKVQQTNDSNDE